MGNTNNAAKPVCLVQVTDPHLFAGQEQRLLNIDTSASLKGVLAAVQAHEQPDVLLATGDITQDGHADAHQRFIDCARPLAPLLRGLPGNHDSNDTFYRVWQDHAQPVTDVGNWRIVLLDSTIESSNAGHLADDQLALLDTACKQAKDKHVLVAVHHNPVPVGSLWLDSMMIDNGHALLALLNNHPNVVALVWGHVHQEWDSTVNYGLAGPHATQARQLRLLSCPATSLQFTPQSARFSVDNAQPGYRRIWLHPDGRLDTEVVRVQGLDICPDHTSGGY